MHAETETILLTYGTETVAFQSPLSFAVHRAQGRVDASASPDDDRHAFIPAATRSAWHKAGWRVCPVSKEGWRRDPGAYAPILRSPEGQWFIATREFVVRFKKDAVPDAVARFEAAAGVAAGTPLAPGEALFEYQAQTPRRAVDIASAWRADATLEWIEAALLEVLTLRGADPGANSDEERPS